MAKIPDGCILLARKLMESEIWWDKPAWWLKVWVYLILQVNHKGNLRFRRGEGFFSIFTIFKECHLASDGIEEKSIKNLLRWLRQTRQITSRRTIRGIIISVCNYDEYQNLSNYRNDTESDVVNTRETPEKIQRDATINNNVNNDNNKDTVSVPEEILFHFNNVCKKRLTLTDSRKRLIDRQLSTGRTAEQLKQAITNFSRDDWPDRYKYMDLVYAIGTIRGIDNFEKWIDFKPGRGGSTRGKGDSTAGTGEPDKYSKAGIPD